MHFWCAIAKRNCTLTVCSKHRIEYSYSLVVNKENLFVKPGYKLKTFYDQEQYIVPKPGVNIA